MTTHKPIASSGEDVENRVEGDSQGRENLSSTSAHTPGPWHVSRGELLGVVEIGVDDARDNFICTMHGVPPTNNEANARLIAAAPDLLETMRDLVGLIEADFNYVRDSEALLRAKAALSKARGGA